MEFKDYYKILGLAKNAGDQEIKAAYRKLARKYHPDLNPGDKKAEERFKEINEAYQILSNSEKRRKYDEMGSNWEQILRDREYARKYAQPGFEGFGPEAFDLGDFFETFFGRPGPEAGYPFTARPPSGPQRGTDLENEVQISLEEAYQGSEKRLSFSLENICADCRGSGMKVAAAKRQEQFRIITEATTCQSCQGTGIVVERKSLQVKIPRGVVEGARVRLAGMGGKGINGGPPGDLYLRIRMLPHKKIVPRGNDLYCELPVLDYEAALGAEIQVPALDGSVWLKVPSGTQTGTQFRLKGKGLPYFEGKGSGDLYFTVKIVIPPELSEKEKELLKQFRSSRQQRGEKDPRKGLL